jgi:uncharacterized protein YggU (UPF0235/DUF167 family)
MKDGILRAYVCAAPTDGQANSAVCELVAKRLKLPESHVTLKRGHTSREKTLWIDGMSEAEVTERVRSA